MKICEYCNQTIDDSADICPCCGAKPAKQSSNYPDAQKPSAGFDYCGNQQPLGYGNQGYGYNNPNLNMPPIMQAPVAPPKKGTGKGTAAAMIIISIVMVIGVLIVIGNMIGKIESDKVKNIEETFGTTSGNTYKNDFAGLDFTLPDGWEFDSESLKDMGAGTEFDEKTGKYMITKQGKYLYYDMYSHNPNTGECIISGILSNNTSEFAKMTPDEIVENLYSDSDNLSSENSKTKSITINNIEYKYKTYSKTYSIDYNSTITVDQQVLAAKPADNAAVVIYITAVSDLFDSETEYIDMLG